MVLVNKLADIRNIFLDTAPIIYFIEEHPEFGQRVRTLFKYFLSNKIEVYTSVITLTEVLPKPVELGNTLVANQFLKFLKNRKYFSILEISYEIAIQAGNLRGQYSFLKSMDAIQLASAMSITADAFITNDKKLKQVKNVTVWTMDDIAS